MIMSRMTVLDDVIFTACRVARLVADWGLGMESSSSNVEGVGVLRVSRWSASDIRLGLAMGVLTWESVPTFARAKVRLEALRFGQASTASSTPSSLWSLSSQGRQWWGEPGRTREFGARFRSCVEEKEGGGVGVGVGMLTREDVGTIMADMGFPPSVDDSLWPEPSSPSGAYAFEDVAPFFTARLASLAPIDMVRLQVRSLHVSLHPEWDRDGDGERVFGTDDLSVFLPPGDEGESAIRDLIDDILLARRIHESKITLRQSPGRAVGQAVGRAADPDGQEGAPASVPLTVSVEDVVIWLESTSYRL